MKLVRLLRHLFATRWSTQRCFTPEVCRAIESAIRDVEAKHAGEIRFAVETALDVPELWRDLPSRLRAVQVFGQLGVWDTAHNNGVLIYVLMADHAVEIIADRGISTHIGAAEWDEVCRQMQAHFHEQRFREGSVAGIQGVGRLLARHFPASAAGTDELPNQPVLL